MVSSEPDILCLEWLVLFALEFLTTSRNVAFAGSMSFWMTPTIAGIADAGPINALEHELIPDAPVGMTTSSGG